MNAKIDWLDFITRLQNMEGDAARMGMFVTMHAINRAVQEAGWEQAELRERASKKDRPP